MDLFLLIYWLHQAFIAACRILVPQPRIEPWPPALGAHSLKHLVTREIPRVDTFKPPYLWASQVALVVKNLSDNAGDTRDTRSISGLGRSPEKGNGNLLQYSCRKNPMDRGACWATVHGVSKSWTQSRTQLSIWAYLYPLEGSPWKYKFIISLSLVITVK